MLGDAAALQRDRNVDRLCLWLRQPRPRPGAVAAEPEAVEPDAPVEDSVEVLEDALLEVEPEPVTVEEAEPIAELAEIEEPQPEPEFAASGPAKSAGKAGFSKKFFESLASGFYGRPAEVELDLATARLEAGEPDDAEVEPHAPAEQIAEADEEGRKNRKSRSSPKPSRSPSKRWRSSNPMSSRSRSKHRSSSCQRPKSNQRRRGPCKAS